MINNTPRIIFCDSDEEDDDYSQDIVVSNVGLAVNQNKSKLLHESFIDYDKENIPQNSKFTLILNETPEIPIIEGFWVTTINPKNIVPSQLRTKILKANKCVAEPSTEYSLFMQEECNVYLNDINSYLFPRLVKIGLLNSSKAKSDAMNFAIRK